MNVDEAKLMRVGLFRRLGLIASSIVGLPGLWLGSAQANEWVPPPSLEISPRQNIASTYPRTHVNSDPIRLLLQPSQTVSHLTLRLSERRLYAYQGDRQVESYPVAIGRDGWQTPTGEFIIFQLQRHPAWEHPFTGEIVPPGEDNPLGARWIGFWTDGTNFIGFHGTPDEQLIGQAVSHGCVRMRDEDVIELYERVQIGTVVRVLP